MSEPIDTVLQRLREKGDVKQRGKGWRCLCPSHDDTAPSLDIDVGNDSRVLFQCRSRGCSAASIASALGLSMRDLFNGTMPNVDKIRYEDRIQREYDYCDERGNLLYQNVRLWAPPPDNKTFRQRRKIGDKWEWSLGDARRVLYRLPDVVATGENGLVFVVEGEKDVENLRALGLVATTSGGAKSWRKEYAEFLRRRRVVVLNDNDEPGRKYADDVRRSLEGIAASVVLIDLVCDMPALPEKGDVSDWLAAGGAKEKLLELVAAASKVKSKWPDPVPISALSGEVAEVDWFWQGCIARRHVTLFSALMKAGKTTLVGHLLRALQEGREFCDRRTQRCRTLVVSEESKAIWRERRDALGLDDSLAVLCRPFICKPTFADWSDFLSHVCRCAGEFRADLVAFDTLAAFAPWRCENDSAEVMATLTPLNQLSEAGHGVLLFHHHGKADQSEGRAARGSTALAGAVDVLLEMRRFKPDDSSDRRRVLSGLGRFDEIPEEIVLELAADGSGYTACGDRKAVAARELREVIMGALPSDPPGLTAADVHGAISGDERPKRGDVGKALTAGIGRDWLATGSGKKGDPYRFWRG